MKMLQSVLGNRKALLRVFGTRTFAATAEEYARRNYASNVSEYNTVFSSLSAQWRTYLLRDAYDDMLLDGVQPTRDTFHSLIIGSMKGTRVQEAFFFRDEMKKMGLPPDVAVYNFLISTCGRSKFSDSAVQILEEMKNYGVKPNGQTYICLLNACAATGRLDRVYAIVRDMTAAGLGLNNYCYAGLITAHVNATPVTEETFAKIIELVDQSKGWSSLEASSNPSAENVMVGVSEEELYNLPTAKYVSMRGVVIRQLAVYHVALHACAELRNVETMRTIMDMLKKDGRTPDSFILMQSMRCYLRSGDLDGGLKVFEDFLSSRPPLAEVYVALAEGAMTGYTERGMQIARETLEKMDARNFFLNTKMASDLLLAAAGEKTGGYTTANYIWDLLQIRKVNPSVLATETYYNGLKDREIPADDPRILHVGRTLDNLRSRISRG